MGRRSMIQGDRVTSVRAMVKDHGRRGMLSGMRDAGAFNPGLKWSVLVTVAVLPTLLVGLGAWEGRRGALTRAEYEQVADTANGRTAELTDLQRRDASAAIQGPGETNLHSDNASAARAAAAQEAAQASVLVARLRELSAGLALTAGLATGAAGLAGLLLISRSARGGARSRLELVDAFGRVSRTLPVLLGTQVVGTLLGLLGVVTFEVAGLWFLPDPDDRTVLLAILVVIGTGLVLWGGLGTLRNLRRALRTFAPRPLAIAAISIDEPRAPGLFALLRTLARERGTQPPEVVAVGAEDGFFVTALPVLLYGAPGTDPVSARGRTLHLPLALLGTLDAVELRTVLAHELAHFSGEDTDYSVRFQPLFEGLGQGAAAMSQRQRDVWGSTLVDRLFEQAAHPHTALAVHAFEQFDHAVAQWRRLRELEADRAAVASGSAAALASSLLRLGIAETLLRAERIDLAERPDAAASDLAAAVAARIGTEGGDAAAHLSDQAPHPTDTHPPTWQRIEAAGVAVDPALLARAARPVDSADLTATRALFGDFDALSSEVTGHLRDRALQRLDTRRDRLRATAAATVCVGETALHAALGRPVAGLALLGSVCLALSITCVLAARYGGEQDRDAWRLLFGIAAAGDIGLGFVALWSVRLWRGSRQPYLVLDEDGIRSPGFAGQVHWVEIAAIGVSAWRSPTTWFVLRPDVPLPQRTGLLRRLRLDRTQHAVQFMAMLPRGLDATALRTLLLRHAKAANARDLLRTHEPAPEPTASGEA